MTQLIHLIYSSAATKPLEAEDLKELLAQARRKNERLGITGMLLHEKGNFFQVLEGEPDAVDALYARISKDDRHTKTVIIIREPIAKRSFSEWTMGFLSISPQVREEIAGLNDFFAEGLSFSELNSGRAKKLLSAFKEGRWRSKVNYALNQDPKKIVTAPTQFATMQPATMHTPKVSFAYQPIVDAKSDHIVAYEALIRGQQDERFLDILPKISPIEWSLFDTGCRALAISLAARLGLSCNLHLNFMARHTDDAHASIHATLNAAKRNHIDPNRIILEIDQDRLIGDMDQFAHIIQEYRGAGLKISIDHFGAGRSGLNLLEPLRPEMIALNSKLVRDIDKNGSRQAIVRGVNQTCRDLGINVIAKYVETPEEYEWFCHEGIHLFQGNLLCVPSFEQLPTICSVEQSALLI